LRILVVILQYPPDVNSTGLLMEQVCRGLRALGHDLSVITTFPHYEKFRVWDEYRGKLLERSRHEGIDVLRLYVHARGEKQRMWNRLLSYLSFNVLATLAGVLSRRRYDVILCTNGGFFSGITAAAIATTKRIPFVLNVQDLYPDVPVMTGQLREGRAVAMLRLLERFMYRAAAHIAVISPAFERNLLAKHVPAHKISVVPNFVDTDFIRPLPRENAFSERHGLAGKFVVMHAGNVGYVYDLDTLLDAAALLKDEREIEFVVVGDGVMKPHLEARACTLGLENVRFLPFQPLAELPWLRATADVQVSLYKHGSAGNSMPSKVYEIMASGRPLLASAEEGSDVAGLVEATQCGLCVAPERADLLAAAVLRLYREPSLGQEMGARGRAHAERSYAAGVVIAQYEALLRQVAGCTAQPSAAQHSLGAMAGSLHSTSVNG
jgi:colanic acid biosynthesis glycosyl transferase WcaI